ncbi:MAG: hypothetical protein B7Z72_05865 [Gemmatimonadetes bacterium 21-71-4]|nr:MAG: hypothetical protein B7Z72_05865 [Gemmatimonadetes bacterium 21-71-4]
MLTRRGASLSQIVITSVWLGAALLLAAAVAPAAFAVLPSRSLAGALVGRVLPVIFWSGMLLFASVMVLGVWTDARSKYKPRVLAAAVGGTACMIAQFAVDVMIERVRARAVGPIDALPATDPLRVAFGQLHLFSVVLLGLAMLAATAVLVLALRGERRPSTP